MARKNEAPKGEEKNEAPKGEEKNPQAEAPKGPKLTPIRKITVKEVYGTIGQKSLPPLRINLSDEKPEGDPNPSPEMPIMRVSGYASGVKTGDSGYGEWAALTGEFVARNADTGEIFGARVVIVPGSMGDALVSATRQALVEDADAKVRFSVDVSVKRSAREPGRKYEYVVRPVIDALLSSPALELLGLEE